MICCLFPPTHHCGTPELLTDSFGWPLPLINLPCLISVATLAAPAIVAEAEAEADADVGTTQSPWRMVHDACFNILLLFM